MLCAELDTHSRTTVIPDLQSSGQSAISTWKRSQHLFGRSNSDTLTRYRCSTENHSACCYLHGNTHQMVVRMDYAENLISSDPVLNIGSKVDSYCSCFFKGMKSNAVVDCDLSNPVLGHAFQLKSSCTRPSAKIQGEHPKL